MRWWWHPPCVLSRVIVNLRGHSDEALQGIFWSMRGGWITLRECQGLTSGQEPTKIDGEVIVHVDQVAYIQKLAT
jgi:hypothetical protein